MIEVKPYFKNTDGHKTILYVTEKVRKAINEHARAKSHLKFSFVQALKRWSERGFETAEGGKGFPIKHEWDQIYRIGKSDLFRIYGFYHGAGKCEFIAIDAFEKNGQQLNADERARINQNVRCIREASSWKKSANDN